LQIDDVNAVSGAEDKGFHLRIPALGLMTEVNAGFKQFFHCYIRHLISPFWFLPPLSSSRVFTFSESTIKPVGERANYKICFLYQIIFDNTIIIEKMTR
jgi:hypothetical protein